MKSKEINLRVLMIAANLLVICWTVIAFLNLRYHLVGHDYSLAIAQMLDTALHFHLNGLTIQWYTPTFGGGLPAYPDPNNSQFSLLVLLTLWFEPWQAVIISSVLIICLGFLSNYYLFQRILKLHWTSSILGAAFFAANGFIMQRIAVGHLGYQTFPLFTIFLVMLLDPALPSFIAGMILALVAAALIHQAGYFVLVVFGLSLLLTLPIIYIFQPKLIEWKRIILVTGFGGLIALLLAASKLSAVFSFMRFFPRQMSDVYSTGTISGLFGIIMQLLGTMNLTPLLWVARLNSRILPGLMKLATGADYGYWEFDMSLTPVVFGLLIAGAQKFIHHPKIYLIKLMGDRKWLAFILLTFFSWVSVEFILAKGFIYPYLQHLPILGSMHVNARFTAVLLFPIALLAAIIYDRWIPRIAEKKIIRIFLIVNTLSLLPLYSFFTISRDLQDRIYDISSSASIYHDIKAGKIFEVTSVGNTSDNTQALIFGTSNLNPYDPIFGYYLENFHPEVKAGSIWDISDGFYNMTNPAGYVFPEVNNTRPFERFRVGDEKILAVFAKHSKPDWTFPLYQQVSGWVSAITFALVLIIISVYGIRKKWQGK